LLSSSCTDQGCIEADDFGEYESQTLTVDSNRAEDNCKYDSSLELTDANQGTGLKSYFTSGSTVVYDQNNVSYTSTNGCEGFTDASIQALCVSNAVQKCLSSSGASETGPEPNWEATDERSTSSNSGVTIYANSQISIRATGSVTLGDKVSYSSHYISPTNFLATSQNTNWEDQIFDVKNGQTLNVLFSGKWDDGADSETGGNVSSQTVGGGSTAISNADTATYNGARRTVMYAIAQPDGYSFDSTKTTETDGSFGVPLLPDPSKWQCVYSGSTTTESTCSNKSYSSTSPTYPNVSDASVNSVFPVTSASQSSILGQYGGLIRWTGDGLLADNNDPFTEVSCNSSATCTGTVPTDIAQGGKMLGDISASSYTLVATNPSSSLAYKVSFKSFLTSTACDTALSVVVKSSTDSVLYTYDGGGAPSYTAVGVTNAAWSTTSSPREIALEPGQKLYAKTTASTGSVNCGRVIGVKFRQYQDIAITQSGLVYFAILNGASGTSCTISGSIINPLGSHTDVATDLATTAGFTSGYSADFYEYNEATNPLRSGATNNIIGPPTGSNWSNPIFVRKGQKLRLSPASWNGTFLTDNVPALTRQCGIGMAIKIIPRPALLCRGVSSDSVSNSLCSQDYDPTTAVLLGCRSDYTPCNDSTDTTYYCPSTCQTTITCSAGTSSNNYTKTCSSGAAKDSAALSACGSGVTAAKCLACYNKMYANAITPALVSKTLDQCYDLENYSGKVSNIPSSTGFSSTQLADSNYAKGATKLGDFNGTYGNFEGFSDSATTDSANNSNIIYQLKLPVTFGSASRLKFFFLDGADFLTYNNAYSNNSGLEHSSVSSYSGINGFRVDLTGMLEFKNGEMLAAQLCSEKTGSCRGGTISTGKTPNIIAFDSTVTTSTPNAASNYQFNSSGTLVRTTTPVTPPDCTDSTPTSTFYCHTTTTDENKLRLTFKIIDPETSNCNIASPRDSITSTVESSLDGVLMTNPAYDPSLCLTGTPSTSCNTNAICTASETPSTIISTGQTKCTKQYYCANKYANNSGKYYVLVKATKPSNSSISSIISGVITPVIEVMDGKKDGSTMGQSERMYKAVIDDDRYQSILSMCLVVMLTFYGVGHLMGVSEFTHQELVSRILKVGLIYLFVSPDGWTWFNDIVVHFFKNSTDYIAFMMASSFDTSPELATAINGQDYYDKSILFSSVDKVFGMFFSDAVQKKISALLFASIFGWAYLWIIYLSFMLYVYSVANAVLLYLTAQVFISILFTLGPIFFVFTLFNQTKDMFENWLKQLIGFSLQQIFLLTTLAFFNMMMYEVIKMSLGYKICWDEVWVINIITRISLMSFWTIASLPPRLNSQSEVGNIGNPDGIPSLFSILFIWVIASLMNTFIGFMTDLAASIGGGLSASSLGSGVSAMASSLGKYASSIKGQISKATIGAVAQRLDKSLFDSGALADKARADKKAEHAKDSVNIGQLSKAADAAEDKLKSSSAYNSLKTEGEKKAALKGARDSAMAAKAKDLGISDKKLDELKNKKGSTYEGNNLAGLAAHTMGQKMKGDKLMSSLNDRGSNTSITKDQAKAAQKNMTKDQRAEFKKGMQTGQVKLQRGALGTMKGGLGALGRAAMDPKKSASDALSAMKNAPGNALGAAKNAVMGDDASSQARQELIDQGAISELIPGTEFSRSDEEKQMIQERAEQIRESKGGGNFKGGGNSPEMMADLDAHGEMLDDLDQTEETDNVIKEGSGGISEKLFGRKKMKLNPFAKARKKEKSVKESKQVAADAVGENIKNEVASAKESVKSNETARDIAGIALKGGTTSNYDKMNKELSEIKERQKSPKSTEGKSKDEMKEMLAEQAKDEKRAAEIEGNSEFKTISKGQEVKKLQEKKEGTKSISEKKAYESQISGLKNDLAGSYQKHDQDAKLANEKLDALQGAERDEDGNRTGANSLEEAVDSASEVRDTARNFIKDSEKSGQGMDEMEKQKSEFLKSEGVSPARASLAAMAGGLSRDKKASDALKAWNDSAGGKQMAKLEKASKAVDAYGELSRSSNVKKDYGDFAKNNKDLASELASNGPKSDEPQDLTENSEERKNEPTEPDINPNNNPPVNPTDDP